MNLTLKNGETINLDVGPLFLEYLDDYEGGIEQLITDWKSKKNLMYIINFFAYSIIAANYNRPIEKRDSLKLISIEDLEKISNFISEKLPDIENTTNNFKNSKHF